MTTTYKDTNPKDSMGSNRAPLHLTSVVSDIETSLVLQEGGSKYGFHNFAALGCRASVYIAALRRHVARYVAGRNRDPSTRCHELAYARACIDILLECEARGNLVDDRGPALPPEVLDRLLRDAEAITADISLAFDLAPGARHWTIDDSVPFGGVAGQDNRLPKRPEYDEPSQVERNRLFATADVGGTTTGLHGVDEVPLGHGCGFEVVRDVEWARAELAAGRGVIVESTHDGEDVGRAWVFRDGKMVALTSSGDFVVFVAMYGLGAAKGPMGDWAETTFGPFDRDFDEPAAYDEVAP